MPNFIKSSHTTTWIPVEQISVVWISAQQPPNEKTIEKIMVNFDPDAFQNIQVSLPNGKNIHHCVDGQNRVEAVRRMWGPKERVPCNVLNAKDPARAADLFMKINVGRQKPQAMARFLCGVTAGYEAEVNVSKLLNNMGYSIGMDGYDGTISAVGTCLAVYRRYGLETLRNALLIIQATWGKERESVDSALVLGYAMMVNKYGAHLNGQRLADRVSKKYTPARLIGAAKSAREVWRGSVADNVVRMLVATYNHGLRAGRLGEKD